MKTKLYKLYEKLREIKTKGSRNYLEMGKFYQKDDFEKLLPLYTKSYDKLRKKDISKFTSLIWGENCRKLEKSFLDSSFSFLRNPVIRENMFVTTEGKLMSSQLRFLKNISHDCNLDFLLEEEYVGNPILSNNKYKTSHNTIHNLYHLTFCEESTKTNLKDMKTIIEWGGGYGNLARLFRKINNNPTYIGIDLPLFSCIQWIYLSSVFGKENINLVDDPKKKIEEGKINLIPVCFLEKFKLKADMFISTWALSESSKYCQDYVIKNNWFNAKHILLALNETDTELISNDSMLKITSIKHQEGNFYAFK